jgi:hypothetical protein
MQFLLVWVTAKYSKDLLCSFILLTVLHSNDKTETDRLPVDLRNFLCVVSDQNLCYKKHFFLCGSTPQLGTRSPHSWSFLDRIKLYVQYSVCIHSAQMEYPSLCISRPKLNWRLSHYYRYLDTAYYSILTFHLYYNFHTLFNIIYNYRLTHLNINTVYLSRQMYIFTIYVWLPSTSAIYIYEV